MRTEVDPIKQKQLRRRRNWCILICCLLCALIVAVVISATLLVTQFKMPSTNVNQPSQPQQLNYDGQSVSTNFTIDVQVLNENKYDIYVASSKMQTYLNHSIPFVNGEKLNYNVVGQTLNNFTIYLSGQWDTKSDEGKAIDNYIYSQCSQSVFGGAEGTLEIDYTVDLEAKVFSLGPFQVPQIRSTTTVPCPSNSQLLGILQGLLSQSDLLQNPVAQTITGTAQAVGNNPVVEKVSQNNVVANTGEQVKNTASNVAGSVLDSNAAQQAAGSVFNAVF